MEEGERRKRIKIEWDDVKVRKRWRGKERRMRREGKNLKDEEG